jgi:hypothetical protein
MDYGFPGAIQKAENLPGYRRFFRTFAEGG